MTAAIQTDDFGPLVTQDIIRAHPDIEFLGDAAEHDSEGDHAVIAVGGACFLVRTPEAFTAAMAAIAHDVIGSHARVRVGLR